MRCGRARPGASRSRTNCRAWARPSRNCRRSDLTRLPLSETLLDAVRAWKRTTTHEGKRRQMQFIGKLMRGADVEPIRAAVIEMQLGRAQRFARPARSRALARAHSRERRGRHALDRRAPRHGRPAAAHPRAQCAQGCDPRGREAQRTRLSRTVPLHPSAQRRRWLRPRPLPRRWSVSGSAWFRSAIALPAGSTPTRASLPCRRGWGGRCAIRSIGRPAWCPTRRNSSARRCATSSTSRAAISC